ncbi:unnamed protein product [Fusarium venenatum]|uniref:Uncharacterized protein n=1 Tax=Fusarium venenatum TaxID=56646 RepID=A0A2L2TPH9_9HYPO|nr:uncharacterized protein FVRRES_01848 [Fusarium venenatum]CEI65336.1 unnamed protein product [Fusarium venenatum]
MSDDSGSEESGLNDKSNQDDDDDDGKSPPKKKVRRGPVKGAPRKGPYIKCVNKMLDGHVIGPGQGLQKAAILVYNGKTVNNWVELVTQFKQASERGAAPRTAAPQAGLFSLSFAQATARARPQRENPRREGLPQEATGTNSAQFAPTVPQLVNRDSQAQLLQEAQAHNHRLEQLITQTNGRINQLTVVVRLLQQSLQTKESGFTAISSAELRQMHNEMRRVNGADNADLPSFTP